MCLCSAVARSRVQQCVTVLFARGVTEQSRHLNLSGSALPFPRGGLSLTLRQEQSQLGVTSTRFRAFRSRSSRSSAGRTVDVCQVSTCGPAQGSRSPQAAYPQALVLKKSLCATVERWECTLLVHERDSQFAVCPQHCRLHILSYPMSTSLVFPL